MSCYFRHIGDIFQAAGVDPQGEKRKELDRIIHQFLGIEYKSCPETWKKLKEEVIPYPDKKNQLIELLRASS
ncbi:hypothetical protein [Dehalococcoides mccartyi]|uniref:Uncharacterized protein n=2 Tax=Dehalococcoides mccartyi TaxID=61435 RepID=A0AB38Z9R7_9CHLR|nr:hypothetical protein [Dehalococcoides mccartyi]AAW39159.1 hypothetical protein DET0017 [Dehalococcoides mccartyi 195]OBW60826.1 MAG: hypothetical protein A9181_05935 [Dehalococcoides mccartyi]WRO07337.1 hypothetical protein VLL09_00085 [Dehalococcoides mccartyi]